jgi:hypothetical protein
LDDDHRQYSLRSREIISKTANYNILSTENNYIFTNEGASSQVTFLLPECVSGYVSSFIKLEPYNFIISANTGDYIADSSVGGTIYNDLSNEDFATITLLAVNDNKWVITGADGTWKTT